MSEATVKERLVEKAAELFWTRGYAATGVADILKEAGAGSGSLYYHYASKDELAIAVLDLFLRLLDEAIVRPVYARHSDPLERLFGILAFYRSYLSANGCTRGCPIGNFACEVSDTHDRLRAKIAELFEAWRAAIRRCVEDAAEQLSPDVEAAGVGTFVLSVMEGAVMQTRVQRSLSFFDASIAELRRYFAGLRRPSAAEEYKGPLPVTQGAEDAPIP